jgi:hypothetical protein
VERASELRTADWGACAPIDTLASIRQRVAELATTGSAQTVDEVWRSLVEARNQPGLPALIHELLEQGHLERVRDSHGNTLRFVLIDTLLELGFPHALEVRPEDLEFHRFVTDATWRPGAHSAELTIAAGVGAFAWTALWSLGLVSMLSFDPRRAWVLVPLAIALVHAVVAIVYAAKARVSTPDKRNRLAGPLSKLGWMGFIGLGTIALAQLVIGGSAGVVTTVVALPSMITAALSAFTAWRIRTLRLG